MHWSIECGEKLREANLQAAKLKKLLDSELACKKEIDEEAELMQIKWDEFERTHFDHRRTKINGMRATMDQVHREATIKRNAVMEALAQKNATMAAEEEAAAAKKKAEEEAAASAAKKKAEADAAATDKKKDEAKAVKDTKEYGCNSGEVSAVEHKKPSVATKMEKERATEEQNKEDKVEDKIEIVTKRTPLPLRVIAAAAAKKKAEEEAAPAAAAKKKAEEEAAAAAEIKRADEEHQKEQAEATAEHEAAKKVLEESEAEFASKEEFARLKTQSEQLKQKKAAADKMAESDIRVAVDTSGIENASTDNINMADVDTSESKMEIPAKIKESDTDEPEEEAMDTEDVSSVIEPATETPADVNGKIVTRFEPVSVAEMSRHLAAEKLELLRQVKLGVESKAKPRQIAVYNMIMEFQFLPHELTKQHQFQEILHSYYDSFEKTPEFEMADNNEEIHAKFMDHLYLKRISTYLLIFNYREFHGNYPQPVNPYRTSLDQSKESYEQFYGAVQIKFATYVEQQVLSYATKRKPVEGIGVAVDSSGYGEYGKSSECSGYGEYEQPLADVSQDEEPDRPRLVMDHKYAKKCKAVMHMYCEKYKADKNMWSPTGFQIGINYQPHMPNSRNLYGQGNRDRLLKQDTTCAKFPSVCDLYYINVSQVEEPDGLRVIENSVCNQEYREDEHGMCTAFVRVEIINKDSIEFKPPEGRRFILEQHANIVRSSVEGIGYGSAHNIGGFGPFVKPVHIIKDSKHNAAARFEQLAPRSGNVNLFGDRSNSEVDSLENENLTSSDRQINMKLGQSSIDRVIAGLNQCG